MTGREEHSEWSNVDIVKPMCHSLRLLWSINGFETLAWSKQCYLETSEKYSAPMVSRNLVRFELTNPIGTPFSLLCNTFEFASQSIHTPSYISSICIRCRQA